MCSGALLKLGFALGVYKSHGLLLPTLTRHGANTRNNTIPCSFCGFRMVLMGVRELSNLSTVWVRLLGALVPEVVLVAHLPDPEVHEDVLEDASMLGLRGGWGVRPSGKHDHFLIRVRSEHG